MKNKNTITFLIRIAAIVFMAIGFWLIYKYFLWKSVEPILFIAPYLIAHGILCILTGYHLFKLEDIGRKIALGILCIFVIPNFAFIVTLIVNFIAPPFGQVSLWDNPWWDASPRNILPNAIIFLTLTVILAFIIFFLAQNDTKSLFQKEAKQSKENISLPKRTFFIAYHVFLGCLVGYAISLGLGSMKMLVDVYSGFTLGSHLGAPPSRYLLFLLDTPLFTLLGAYNAYLVEGDFILNAIFLGGVLCFAISLRRLLFIVYSEITATKVFRFTFTILSIITVLFFTLTIINNIRVQSTYHEFCAILRSKDYISAYKFISPEFQKTHQNDKAPYKRVLEFWDFCNNKNSSGIVFVTSLGKQASIFPEDTFFTLVDDSESHPVLPMEKIDGKWYLTGRGAYKFEWFGD